jgi:beta-1,4-mannosyltransferase
MDAVEGCAARLDAEIVVVTQVARDVERCQELAERWGARHVAWVSDDHLQQELAVRAVYRRALAVISDRLHVLILGATEGAVPLGWCEHATTKIDRHFDVVGAPWVGRGRVGATAALDELDGPGLASLAARAERVVAQSRSRVDEVAGRIRSVAGSHRPVLRVLHSLRPPDGTTRYVDQMIAAAPPAVSVLTFSWPRALLGSYDVFQLHWPESLLRHRTRLGSSAKRLLTRMLLLRLRVTRTPLVRTAHNLAPHEAGDAGERRLLAALQRRTAHWIALNPTTELPAGASASVILHGHYRDRFDRPAGLPVRGRVLQFGLIRPYKGVERLIETFVALNRPDLSLRVVGKPIDDEMRREVETRAAQDPRVQLSLAFVPDDELAREVHAAELVVLPYRELHNSGVALVALSLDRPVLVPRTPSSEALRGEAGPEWVLLFDGELTAQVLEAAIDRAAGTVRAGGGPDLRGRDWDTVGRRHAEVYRRVLGGTGS